jgi:micrococcal nuclease
VEIEQVQHGFFSFCARKGAPVEVVQLPTVHHAALPSVTPAPTARPAPTPRRSTYPLLPAGLSRAQVVRVVDGDTVDVTVEDGEERVRLIGLDAPETHSPREPVQCFGADATRRAQQLLDGQDVFVELDPTQGVRDRYGRLLGYLWLADGRLFNLEMVAEGYAFEYTYDRPYKYQAEFQQAERDAQAQQGGLWSPQTCNGESRPATP